MTCKSGISNRIHQLMPNIVKSRQLSSRVWIEIVLFYWISWNDWKCLPTMRCGFLFAVCRVDFPNWISIRKIEINDSEREYYAEWLCESILYKEGRSELTRSNLQVNEPNGNSMGCCQLSHERDTSSFFFQLAFFFGLLLRPGCFSAIRLLVLPISLCCHEMWEVLHQSRQS